MKQGSKAVASAKDRATFVSKRLSELSSELHQGFIEIGQLLVEYQENALYKEEGYPSFNEAIDAKQSKGELDFGSRNARNAIAVAKMITANNLTPAQVKDIPPSILREIATLHPEQQKKMLPEAKNMTTAEVQQQAKEIRHKNKGLDVDPYDPIILRDATATAKVAFNTHIATARRVYQIPENVPDYVVLVDHILPEWEQGVSAPPDIDIEAEIDNRLET
jgi:hypothetical protein